MYTKQHHFKKLMDAYIKANNIPMTNNEETNQKQMLEFHRAESALMSFIYQHRDEIIIGGKSVEQISSQGQSKSSVSKKRVTPTRTG